MALGHDSHKHGASSEAQSLLLDHVATLRATQFETLVERFTETGKGRFRPKAHRVGRAEEITEIRGPSGRTYDLEVWAVPETESRLHMFVSVMGNDIHGQWTEVKSDFLIETAP